MRPILILGGTTEASRLAQVLADRGLPALLSYAGRTGNPRPQPVPVRVGGFGGAEGLAAYLRTEGIGRVIDATHPFAARISTNAVAACALACVPLLAVERPAWRAAAGDLWTPVPDMEQAAQALGPEPRRVFLAIGKLQLAAFAGHPQHHYLLRLVDPPGPLPLPRTTVEIATGPFDAAADQALMQRHGIQLIVAKNAGGQGAEAKLQAARTLRLPVLLVDRPVLPPRETVATVEEALAWVHADLGV